MKSIWFIYIYIIYAYVCACVCIHIFCTYFLPLMYIEIETLTHEFISLGAHRGLQSRISFELKTNILKFLMVNVIFTKFNKSVVHSNSHSRKLSGCSNWLFQYLIKYDHKSPPKKYVCSYSSEINHKPAW